MTTDPRSGESSEIYEPCVIDESGRCTRWSHNHLPKPQPFPTGTRFRDLAGLQTRVVEVIDYYPVGDRYRVRNRTTGRLSTIRRDRLVERFRQEAYR